MVTQHYSLTLVVFLYIITIIFCPHELSTGLSRNGQQIGSLTDWLLGELVHDDWSAHLCRIFGEVRFLCIASPQQGDLRLSDPPSGPVPDGSAQT
ncbi:hypothetical protein PoB_000683300 [Plakobranchus ocellatus]|uniref:Secreted protein n=1 Tax=Plakobranchus ocellatus TaxID=259542 RepID=A0AAV3YCV0_9GAST|nr:hypothetical protein PoB_000683300 [Plakobranchus ocellatus]